VTRTVFCYGVLFLDEKHLVSSQEKTDYLLVRVEALQNMLSLLYAGQQAPT